MMLVEDEQQTEGAPTNENGAPYIRDQQSVTGMEDGPGTSRQTRFRTRS